VTATWSQIRSWLFRAGVLCLLISPIGYAVFLHFMARFRESHVPFASRGTDINFLNAGKGFVLSLGLDLLALVLVSFGRGWSRIALWVLGILLNFLIVVSL
jgi:hypothetical protein